MSEKDTHFDLTVIGSGPGGYPAAIRAAQTGAKVALIESQELGGTCLNRGCIPSKALIACARMYHNFTKAEDFGLSADNVSFDYPKMVDRADKIVKKIRKGVEGLVKANGITLFRGFGKFTAPNQIKILGEDNVLIESDKTLIASGSEPRIIPAFQCDGELVHDSTSMLKLKKLPKKLIVIGGGVIGCEFASMYNLLGVEVVVLEMLPRILTTECEELSEILADSLAKRGVEIHTEVAVKEVKKSKSGVEVMIEGGSYFKADMALVSVGRKVNSFDIGLDAAGVLVKDNGVVETNEKMETGVDSIYAIGDITGKWWLAHVATHHGLIAVSNALGQRAVMHENAVPSVIFTDPEIASVGLTPEKAHDEGIAVTVGRYPFQALGKSQAIGHPEGFAQVVADKKTGQVLGAQIAGHEAATLIAEMALAVANELTLDCVFDTIHAHPTTPEAWMEAALLANGTPIHLPPKKKRESDVASRAV
jgi:dihydrolipoamide dehydrogenase